MSRLPVKKTEEPLFKVHLANPNKRKAISPSTSKRKPIPPTTRKSSTTALQKLKPVVKLPQSSSQPPAKRPKRAAWDTKGRLEDLEENFNQTNSKLVESQAASEESKKKIKELEEFKFSLENNVLTKEKENCEITHKVTELSSTLDEQKNLHVEKINSLTLSHQLEIEKFESKLKNLNSLVQNLEETKEILKNSEDLLKSECHQLKSTISNISCTSLVLESQIKQLKAEQDSSTKIINQNTNLINSQISIISQNESEIKQLEEKLRNEEAIRRGLHNTIQELKGNIRVFCRVRPLIGDEVARGLGHMKFNDDHTLELNQSMDSASGTKISKSFPFSFDKVFTATDTQNAVFEEISQLVQSSLDGYNVSIFAYGQTGSGKTFTMEGSDIDKGMIPRAVNQIFETSSALESKGWAFSFETNFLEIYNETIKDLLIASNEDVKLEVRHTLGKTLVENARCVSVGSPDEVDEVLTMATKNRSVASTNCNERSSRSHSVFILRINGTNSITNEKVEGVLNLIDLAGSERLNSSQSTGERLKETQSINKSLSSLGDVIFALSNKESHIPYRNSKLTYLLQNSLGGNSKTLMFVNVNPSLESFGETLCSLRFATKVNNCQIGTAKRVVK